MTSATILTLDNASHLKDNVIDLKARMRFMKKINNYFQHKENLLQITEPKNLEFKYVSKSFGV